MDEKMTLGNVNVLDVRNTPKETFDKLKLIGNVNVILVSPETASYLPGIPAKNINAVAHVPADVGVKTCMSSITLNAHYLEGLPARTFLLVMGRILVESDVTVEMIDTHLAGLVVMGKVVCPDAVLGALQAKTSLMMGTAVPYPADAVLISSSLKLDDAFLNGLPDGTKLVVTGSLRVIDDVSNERIEKKIQSLTAVGSVLCRQEHAMTLKAKLERPGDMVVIPAQHRLIEGILSLDELSIQSLDGARLFCLSDVLISNDVEATLLERALTRIESLGVIVCPAKLKDVLKSTCDMLGNRVILYEHNLWYVDNDRQLLPEQFDYVEGAMTIVNRGDLEITEDVSAQMLMEKIDKIHNLGDITCGADQISAIEARLGIRDGDINARKPSEPDVEAQPTVGNANMLVL